MGAGRATSLMQRDYMQAGVALLTLFLWYAGARAPFRRQWASALMHLGCALILTGWLAGRHAERVSTPERPVNGFMAMIDGEESDQLWQGEGLQEYVGKVPFKIKLEKFLIEYYKPQANERAFGHEPPVREYRSRITITKPGHDPYVANVRVNYPVYVKGYYIYQMSWGRSTDRFGRPIIYTVLQFIRDPGVPIVYTGFGTLMAGLLLFMLRVLRAGGSHDH